MGEDDYRETGKIIKEAVRLKREDKLQEARDLLEEGLDEFPYDNYLKASLADVLFRLGELDEALELTDEVLRRKPGDSRALIVKGNVAFYKRDYERALEYYEQAAVNDQGEYVGSRIISTHLKLREYERARDLCQEWLEKKPDSNYFRKLMARIYEKLDEGEKAREYYEDYLDREPEDEFAYKEKIKLKIKDKPAAEAVRELKRVLKVGRRGDNIFLHHLLAGKLEELERYEEAVAEYERALELEPGNEFATKQAGFCLYRMGEYEKALDYLQEAFRRDPGDYYIRSTLVSIYKKLDRSGAGAEFFREIIRNNQGFNKLWGTVKKLSKEAGEKGEN